MSLLKMVIIGNLGRDATIRQVNDMYVVSFSVAHSVRTRTGETSTTWINCSWWHNKEPKVAQYLKKGKQVYIEGTPSARLYTAQDGSARVSLDCRVSTLRLLGGKTDEIPADTTFPQEPTTETTTAQNNQEPENLPPQEDFIEDDSADDLPF